jgi:hypothetical protein
VNGILALFPKGREFFSSEFTSRLVTDISGELSIDSEAHLRTTVSVLIDEHIFWVEELRKLDTIHRALSTPPNSGTRDFLRRYSFQRSDAQYPNDYYPTGLAQTLRTYLEAINHE